MNRRNSKNPNLPNNLQSKPGQLLNSCSAANRLNCQPIYPLYLYLFVFIYFQISNVSFLVRTTVLVNMIFYFLLRGKRFSTLEKIRPSNTKFLFWCFTCDNINPIILPLWCIISITYIFSTVINIISILGFFPCRSWKDGYKFKIKILMNSW